MAFQGKIILMLKSIRYCHDNNVNGFKIQMLSVPINVPIILFY